MLIRSYYYICGSEGAWSEESTFKTSPDSKVSFTVGIYGDMGIHNSEDTVKQVITLTEKGALDWVYHVGTLFTSF